MRRRIRAVAIVAGLLACAGCAPTTTTTVPSTPTSPPPGSAAPTATAVTAVTAPASADGSAGTIVVDAGLVDLLPAEIAGIPLDADPATAAEIAADPTLAGSVTGVAVVTAFGPMPTDTMLDYVVVTLASLQDGVFDDAFYRDWRDSFDQAVCAQAGGIDGHAEADIAEHQTFVATCGGGVRTYHVYLPASDVIVSMQGSGEGRYGELVVAGLTE